MATKLDVIYRFLIQEGQRQDSRNRSQIRKRMQQPNGEISPARLNDPRFFDNDDDFNPYADLRVLHGNPDRLIRRVLVGIDIDTAEILLADRLSVRGEAIDLVMAHHPDGRAWAGLHEVMHIQKDFLIEEGIDEMLADRWLDARIEQMARKLHAGNHSKTVDAARLLDIAFLCCHTPADNCVARYWQQEMKAHPPRTLGALVKRLWQEPEYQSAARDKAGPMIVVGDPSAQAGPVYVDMTGGASGTEEMYAPLVQKGYRTILAMHLSDAHVGKAAAAGMKVVFAGHIASDNLGMNLLMDRLCERHTLEIIPCGGFRRFERHGSNT